MNKKLIAKTQKELQATQMLIEVTAKRNCTKLKDLKLRDARIEKLTAKCFQLESFLDDLMAE